MKCTKENKYHLTAEQVQQEAVVINQELGRFDPMRQHLLEIEVPNTMFSPYIYESQGIAGTAGRIVGRQ